MGVSGLQNCLESTQQREPRHWHTLNGLYYRIIGDWTPPRQQILQDNLYLTRLIIKKNPDMVQTWLKPAKYPTKVTFKVLKAVKMSTFCKMTSMNSTLMDETTSLPLIQPTFPASQRTFSSLSKPSLPPRSLCDLSLIDPDLSLSCTINITKTLLPKNT